jgi:CBS domain-containing protein
MKNSINNNPAKKIYLIFKGKDGNIATNIKRFFEKRGIYVIDYRDEVLSTSPMVNHVKWSKEADFVIILLSNHWIDPGNYIEGELDQLVLIRKNFRESMAIVLLEDLEKEVSETYSFLGVPAKLTEPTLIKITSHIENRKESAYPPPPSPPNLLVKDLMTMDPITYFPDDQLSSLLWDHDALHYRHFPVVELINRRKKLLGIISYRDILKAQPPPQSVIQWVLKDTNEIVYIEPSNKKVNEFWTVHKPPIYSLVTIKPEQKLALAISYLQEKHPLGNLRYISAIPVVDTNEILVGIITYMDILKKFSPLPSGNIMSIAIVTGLRTVSKSATLSEARALMGDIRDLIVMDRDKVVGMLSNYEIYHCESEKFNTKKVPVEEVMKRLPQSLYPTTESDITHAIEVFKYDPTIGAIAILQHGTQKLAGVVSYIDVLKSISGKMQKKD